MPPSLQVPPFAGSRGPALVPGMEFAGGYEIMEEVGVGTFGRVYRARQRSTGRDVAIKVQRLHDGAAAGDLAIDAERFRREMRLSGELSHPNIVRLIDSGEAADGRLYAIFEFVPGVTTLQDVLAAEGALAPAEAIHLMTQVLDALACAHARGVVHRDLKPANIMVTRTGVRRNALVVDFGLGGFTSEAEGWNLARITATNELLGTPCYAAPEQLRGEPTSTRSDLYSWGLILLECLTGELAVAGASGQDVVMRQLGPDPVPIPPWLRKHPIGRLLVAVTAKAVERRTVTVEALLGALTDALTGSVPTPHAASDEDPDAEAHRRQLTVVCCRLGVVSARGEPLDVEEVDAVLRARRRAIADVAARMGGRIASVMADRLLLVFGHPQAREHDARLAARVALQIVGDAARDNPVLEANQRLRLEVRAGIHTGLVIARERAVNGGTELDEVIGVTPEIAAQLDELARPGEVLVSGDVHRLLRGRIGAEPLRDRALPDGRASVFRLTGKERFGDDVVTGRFDRETPLTGRSHQLAELTKCWAEAQRGRSSVILISGEPGIGKSRLIRELRRHVGIASWVECRCVPENQNSPLRPLIDALMMMADPIESLLDRHGLDLLCYMPLFTTLLGRPPDPRFPQPPLTPERRKDLTFDAIVTLLLRMAEERPIAFVMEDLHWADPTTLELLALLVRDVQGEHVLDGDAAAHLSIVLTSRPTFEPTWPLEGTLVMPLARLARDEVEAMVAAGAAGGPVLPRSVLDQVVLHADGVPLFVEEVTRMLCEAGPSRDQSAGSSRAEPAGFDVPMTLRDLLTSRLDELSPEARETGQLAAVLGREFGYEVLGTVSARDDELLRGDLRELADAGLVYHRTRAQPESYVFKHALVRDAAYEMMTRPARQEVHERIAETLRTSFPEVARERPEVLAHHFEGAGRLPDAADYWKRSGDLTMARGAYVESVRHFERGLSLLEGVPGRRAHAQLELGLLESLGTAKLATQGYASPEVEEVFGRAQRLCDEVGEDVPIRVLFGIWGVLIMRGEREATAEFLPRLHRHAERTGDPVSLITAHGQTGLRAFFTGDFTTALQEMTTATQWYDTPEYRAFVREYGYDGGLYPFGYRVLSLWMLGYPDQARQACDELLSLAATSGNPYGLAIAGMFDVLIAILRGEPDLARAAVGRLTAHASEQKLYFFMGPALCAQGWVAVQDGRPDDGIALTQQGLGLLQMIGCRAFYAFYQSFLVEAHLARGTPGEGLPVVEEGLELARTTVDCFYEAELLRLRGELLRADGRPAEAEASFVQSLDLARRQLARSFELRTAMSLGGMLRDRGARDAARALLAPVYDELREGFDSRDLVGARGLLADVAAERRSRV